MSSGGANFSFNFGTAERPNTETSRSGDGAYERGAH
jgi:hypothetical protein